MNVGIFGDRSARLPPGWTKETLVSIFSDTTLDAVGPSKAGGSLTVVGLFSDATVRVPRGSRVVGGGFSLFGARHMDVAAGVGPEVRIHAYGLFCDVKVLETTAEPT